MKYFYLLLLLIVSLKLSAQMSNFGAVTVFNSLACGDSTLNLIPVTNVGDMTLMNCFIVREVFDQNLNTIFKDSSIITNIGKDITFSFEMYLYGENVDQNGNYFIKFTIVADADLNTMNVTPNFNLKITKCCQASLINFGEINCFGASNAFLEVEGIKGTPPYSFFWSNGSNDSKISDLGPGEYSILMFDGSSCIAKDTFVIVQPDPILANIIIQHESKPNENDGTAESMPAGGRPPYTFTWSTGANTPDIVDLPPGDYSLTITDDLECQVIFNFTVDQFMCDLTASIDGPVILCPGESEVYTAVAMKGSAPYTYAWSIGSNTESIVVAAGMYEVTISDSEGCTATAVIDIDMFPSIIVDTTEIVNASGALEDGAIYIDVFGGTPPYGFSWYRDSMIISMEEDLVDFIAGDYTLAVIDSEGCGVRTDTITIEMLSSLVDVEFSFNIFPNPARGQVTFSSNDSWQAEIFNIKGEKINSIPESNVYTWFVKDQSPGIYYARIWNGEELRIRKIVITGE